MIVVIAAAVRFWGLDFGLPFALSRPDETAIAGPAVYCLLGDCRPPDFYYPSLFIYAMAALYGAYFLATTPLGWYADLQAFAASRLENLAPFFLIARGVSALFGTLTVYWVYLLGARAASRAVGLVGSGFLGLAVLHVRDSHFGTSDVTMTALVVLGVLRVLAWYEVPTLANAALAGGIVGLAGSVKYNGIGVGVTFVVAAAIRWWDAGRNSRTPAFGRMTLAAGAFGLALLVAFLGTTPYIVLDWDRFLRDVVQRGEGLSVSHAAVLPPGWLHHPLVSLPASLGWPVYLCGLAGAAAWLAADVRRAAIVFAFPIAYFAVTGSMLTVFARYVIPIVPFLALGAGWLVVTAVKAALPAATERKRAWATAALAGTLILPSAHDVWLMDAAFAREDTRVVAARYLSGVTRPGQTMFRTGGAYGQVPLDLTGLKVDVLEVGFDGRQGRFHGPSGNVVPDPDWLVLEYSPVSAYIDVPIAVERIAASRYRLLTRIKASDERPYRVYDLQDAFFCPLSGLDGVWRLGPNVSVYERLPDARAPRR